MLLIQYQRLCLKLTKIFLGLFFKNHANLPSCKLAFINERSALLLVLLHICKSYKCQSQKDEYQCMKSRRTTHGHMEIPIEHCSSKYGFDYRVTVPLKFCIVYRRSAEIICWETARVLLWCCQNGAMMLLGGLLERCL